MSKFYKGKRSRNLYDPKSKKPFRLSRSKIDLFLSCPRCFYIDRRLGVGRPPGFPFNLNSAVDTLLKKEFDIHRAKNTQHPLMKAYNVDAIPFAHEKMDEWRENFKGVTFLHEPTNFIITGAVDDLWVNPKNEIIVVDYKATSKDGQVNISAPWQIGYKRQMEVYQWLMRKNGFDTSDTGYFVYCNGKTDKEAFDGKLEFDIDVIPYKGDGSWIEKTLVEAHKTLVKNEIPEADEDCDYCIYKSAVIEVENSDIGKCKGQQCLI
ncbi:MAG: PD-(D/E)XK nuclease family protein [Candidatus Magasanikbacteria bacterium]|nr:PD-(D/E)XK nuclease family protein [Candidatus Magasanikbacteria bacterium]